VVGQSSSDIPGLPSYEPFWWSSDTGMLGMMNLLGISTPEYGWHEARAVSGDGSVVVVLGSYLGNRWTFGPYGLTADTVPLDPYYTFDISDDGQVIVGAVNANDILQAALWSEQTGVIVLGLLNPGDLQSEARAVSGDGMVVTGCNHRPVPPDDPVGSDSAGFVWAPETGMVELNGLPTDGRFNVIPKDISQDGARIVGEVWEYFIGVDPQTGEPLITAQPQAFLWTAESGLCRLGFPAGAGGSQGLAISGDGTALGGRIGSVDAFLWHEDLGLAELKPLIADLGCSAVSSWHDLGAVSGLSADGTLVCGWGINAESRPEAWVANIADLYLRVESIDLNLKLVKGSAQATAIVLVKDLAGNPASGALVTAHWSGSAQGTVQGTTDRNGKVKFTSAKVKSATEFTLTVDDVSKALRVHDSYRDLETSETIWVE